MAIPSWTLAKTCATQAQGLNYLVLTGSHDLSQMPPLHSLQRLEIYDADCSKRFPCLTAISVVTKKTGNAICPISESCISLLKKACQEPLWCLLQPRTSQLEDLYLSRHLDLPNQFLEFEWPRLKVFRYPTLFHLAKKSKCIVSQLFRCINDNHNGMPLWPYIPQTTTTIYKSGPSCWPLVSVLTIRYFSTFGTRCFSIPSVD